jgi:hypothetical protein
MRWLRLFYWLLLAGTWAFAVPFAVYLFPVTIPASLALLWAGALASRWPLADWLLPAIILTISAVTSAVIAAAAWGDDAAWAAPFLIWIAAGYALFTVKVGKLFARRREWRRAVAA